MLPELRHQEKVSQITKQRRVAFIGAGLSATVGIGSHYLHYHPKELLLAGFAGWLVGTVRYIAKDRQLDRLNLHQ